MEPSHREESPVVSDIPKIDLQPTTSTQPSSTAKKSKSKSKKKEEEELSPSDAEVELRLLEPLPPRPVKTAMQLAEGQKYPAELQQEDLFYDVRRYQLGDELQEVWEKDNDTHLGQVFELYHYMFEVGRPARYWTAGGRGPAKLFPDGYKSVHGDCSCTYDEADALLLTEREHAIWAAAGLKPKPVVLRDKAFSERVPQMTTEKWLHKALRRAGDSSKIDVQRLDKKCDQLPSQTMTVSNAIEKWRSNDQKAHLSKQNPPYNFLNIQDKTPGYWPEGLSKDYGLLHEVLNNVAQEKIEGRKRVSNVGKATTGAVYELHDLQNCLQFRIAAQRGAASSWHIDNCGVNTWTYLEGNTGDADEKDTDVVKYWPIFPMDHLSPDDQKIAWDEFAKKGVNWRPRPACKIPVLALIKGDMLIQPPGNIHAPITLTNCMFVGGMCWRERDLARTMDVWEYLINYEECTNENLPGQAQAVIKHLRRMVEYEPESFGYTSETMSKFHRQADLISGKTVKCNCVNECGAECFCLKLDLDCGIFCHKGPKFDHRECGLTKKSRTSTVKAETQTTKRNYEEDDDEFVGEVIPAPKKRKASSGTAATAPASAARTSRGRMPGDRIERNDISPYDRFCQDCGSRRAWRWYVHPSVKGYQCHNCKNGRTSTTRTPVAREASPASPKIDSGFVNKRKLSRAAVQDTFVPSAAPDESESGIIMKRSRSRPTVDSAPGPSAAPGEAESEIIVGSKISRPNADSLTGPSAAPKGGDEADDRVDIKRVIKRKVSQPVHLGAPEPGAVAAVVGYPFDVVEIDSIPVALRSCSVDSSHKTIKNRWYVNATGDGYQCEPCARSCRACGSVKSRNSFWFKHTSGFGRFCLACRHHPDALGKGGKPKVTNIPDAGKESVSPMSAKRKLDETDQTADVGPSPPRGILERSNKRFKTDASADVSSATGVEEMSNAAPSSPPAAVATVNDQLTTEAAVAGDNIHGLPVGIVPSVEAASDGVERVLDDMEHMAAGYIIRRASVDSDGDSEMSQENEMECRFPDFANIRDDEDEDEDEESVNEMECQFSDHPVWEDEEMSDELGEDAESLPGS
jgi:hypothetical protein